MKKIIIAIVSLLLISLFVAGSLFAQDSKIADKDTIIRAQVSGTIAFSPESTSDVDFGSFGLGVNYTRFFTELMGLNVGMGMEFPVGTNALSGSDLASWGGTFEAGPAFRFGRVVLSPMVGYGLIYQTVTYTNGDSEIKTEHLFRILFGVDFFFNDFLSIYGEVGYVVGYATDKYTVDSTGVVNDSNLVPQGFCFSLGVGIAY